MTTGQRIKIARKNAGMTQSELSSKLNIPYQSISQWERDLRNPKRETLQRIADALGVSVDYLLGTHHLKGILNYKTAAIRDRIFEAIKQAGLSNEEFCLKLGLPVDEWFKWKEGSSTSYLECLPEISKQLGIPEDILSGEKPDTVHPDRIRLTKAFDKLNQSGQREAIKRIEELSEMPKYTVRFESLTPDEKQLAETGQWGKLWELQFGSCDSSENSET